MKEKYNANFKSQQAYQYEHSKYYGASHKLRLTFTESSAIYLNLNLKLDSCDVCSSTTEQHSATDQSLFPELLSNCLLSSNTLA